MGPDGFQNKDVYLRTAISVEPDGWANFDFVKMPDYRWGIFLKPAQPGATIGFGDNYGQPAYQEVPGEFRNFLRRIIVTQGDTEPASVEQQRELGKTCPSLYDLRNLFQVNVKKAGTFGRWSTFCSATGRDGRDEADALLERRSGNPDKPRILKPLTSLVMTGSISSVSRCSPTETVSISSRRSLSRALSHSRAHVSSC